MIELGRGAFTTVGKDNGLSSYGYRRGKPVDGRSPEKGFNYEAVNLGVLSIEQRLADLGYDLLVDGKFGAKVKRAVKDFQRRNSLPVSGDVGYTTGPVLFKGHIESVGQSHKFAAEYVYGCMRAESGGDPGAVGYHTPGDRGLYQYNTLIHDITYQEAHDFDWSTEAVFTRYDKAWKRYAGKGPDLRLDCSIAQHNAPGWADQWYQSGEAPNDTIKKYVGKIRAFALEF